MPKGRKTSVFVSSTCYDLSQIRDDLHDFFVSIGHLPVLSDYKNFPVDPDLSTFDNCLEAVKNNADIYVLIVGGRYGSVANNGKSITNLNILVLSTKKIYCTLQCVFRFLSKSSSRYEVVK